MFQIFINFPTRVSKTTTTLTDNIFINNFEHKCPSGNSTTLTSDHLPHFTVIENAKDTPLNKTNHTTIFCDFRQSS